jgi:hypothetical protein
VEQSAAIRVWAFVAPAGFVDAFFRPAQIPNARGDLSFTPRGAASATHSRRHCLFV